MIHVNIIILYPILFRPFPSPLRAQQTATLLAETQVCDQSTADAQQASFKLFQRFLPQIPVRGRRSPIFRIRLNCHCQEKRSAACVEIFALF